jgi:hypothetical protein
LGIIFLKKQEHQISHGTEHVEQNRNYDEYFHWPAFKGSGFRVHRSGLKILAHRSKIRILRLFSSCASGFSPAIKGGPTSEPLNVEP